MPPPQVPLGVDTVTPRLNGSFLVLNLEANAVGLENACGFEPFSLRASGVNHGSVNRVMGSIAGSSGNGKASVEKGSSSKARREERKGNRNGRKTVMENIAEPKPREERVEPPPVVVGNEPCTPGWRPPQYLVNLLEYFGWKVHLGEGLRGIVYTSPHGAPYSSLPKVFEIFLQRNWTSGDPAASFSPGDLNVYGKTHSKETGCSKGKAPVNTPPSLNETTSKSVACTATEISTRSNLKAMQSHEPPRCNAESRMNSNSRSCRGPLQVRRSSRLRKKSASMESFLDFERDGALEEVEKEETSSSSDSEYEFDESSDTSTDVEYEAPTRKTRELTSLQKDLRNIKSVRLDGEPSRVCFGSSSGMPLQGSPVDLPKKAPGGETTVKGGGKDPETVIPKSNNKDDGNTPRTFHIAFSSARTTSSYKCGSSALNSVDTSTERASAMFRDYNQTWCATLDGLNNRSNEKKAILHSTNDNDKIQETSDGRKPNKQKPSPPSRSKIDKAIVLPDTSCSKAECDVEAPITEKDCSSIKKRKSTAGSNTKGRKKKRRSGGCGLMVKTKGKRDCREDQTCEPNATVLSWLIDSGILVENEKVLHKVMGGRKKRLGGFITRGGIRCNCCKAVITLLQFEAHAGSAIYQPWTNITRASGESLLQCLMTAWNTLWAQLKERAENVGDRDLDSSDDTCGVCADGGCLVCCDNCSSTFHQDCLLLKHLPEGRWYCPHCTCKFCKVAGPKNERNRSASDLYTCRQCYRKYHLECGEKDDRQRISGWPALFCGSICKQVDTELSNMIGVVNSISDGFSWTLLKRCDDEQTTINEQRSASAIECNVKLSVALSVLEECFLPLVDQRTGLNMLSQAVYNCGSQFKRLSYEGFYTAILEKNDEIISVATLRIHGTQFAEMPFIGTQFKHRRKGMCKRLIESISDMLSSLCVKKLIIPSIPELLETWTSSFHFQPLEEHVRDELRSLSLVVFAETTLLQKTITPEEVEHGDNGSCENQVPNDIQGCADEWIETLVSSDETWFNLCYNSEISKQHRHSENANVIENWNSASKFQILPKKGEVEDCSLNSRNSVSKFQIHKKKGEVEDGPLENRKSASKFRIHKNKGEVEDGPLKNTQGKLNHRPSVQQCTPEPYQVPHVQSSAPMHFFSLPSYNRPFSDTHIGTPTWLEAREARNVDNTYGSGSFSRRQLFQGTGGISAFHDGSRPS